MIDDFNKIDSPFVQLYIESMHGVEEINGKKIFNKNELEERLCPLF